MTNEAKAPTLRRYTVDTAAPPDEVRDVLIRELAMERGHVVYINVDDPPKPKSIMAKLGDAIVHMLAVYGVITTATFLWHFFRGWLK